MVPEGTMVKMPSYQYRDPHVKDKVDVQPLYWEGAQMSKNLRMQRQWAARVLTE